MKKILFAIAAIAALSACSKSEVEYEAAGEITFTPVAKNITKAMMDNGETFNTNEQFNVWAFYNPTVQANNNINAWVAEYVANSENGAKVYIDDKPFAYDGTYQLWAGVTPYFWPKVGTLAFAGYYPSSAPAAYTLSDEANEMTFTDVENSWVSDAETNIEDLMYFNLTKCYNGNNVTAVFKHALAWLTINLSTTKATLDAGATITVSSVKFTEVMPQGDAVVANQAPIEWTPEGDADEVEVVASTVTLGTTAQMQKQPLLIPQTMDGELHVTYTITSTDNSSFTETKVITLNEMLYDGDKELSSWEASKHYVYNIVISTNEILIDASVVNWEDNKVEIPVEVK